MATRLTSKRILNLLITTYGKKNFRQRDAMFIIKERFNRNVTASYMAGILANLRRWGCIVYADKKKRGWGGYVVTDWGRECNARWEMEK